MKTLIALSMVALTATAAETFETVIANGRVMDPDTGLDAIRHVGISKGAIRAISMKPLKGKLMIDAKGLVVAPGIIDMHQHGQGAEDYPYKAMDGVTTALELEVGTADVDLWYKTRKGKAPINFGVSVGHIPVRFTFYTFPLSHRRLGALAACVELISFKDFYLFNAICS